MKLGICHNRDILHNSAEALCPEDPSQSNPQLAKDEGYARIVQDAWTNEIHEKQFLEDKHTVKSITYQDVNSDTLLYGYVVEPALTEADELLPGIILFHTGAGPSDIFLRWKADILVSTLNCKVFIADLLSDEFGKTWTSGAWYQNERVKLMEIASSKDGSVRKTRPLLRQRIQSAVQYLQSVDSVDPNKVIAFGWCLGGRVVEEIGRMDDLDGVIAAVSFHGVVDGCEFSAPSIESIKSQAQISSKKKKILLCNGCMDPFVSDENLKRCTDSLTHSGVEWELLNFKNARHGFTNPAQDINPNEAFKFNADAAVESWCAAIRLCKDLFLD